MAELIRNANPTGRNQYTGKGVTKKAGGSGVKPSGKKGPEGLDTGLYPVGKAKPTTDIEEQRDESMQRGNAKAKKRSRRPGFGPGSTPINNQQESPMDRKQMIELLVANEEWKNGKEVLEKMTDIQLSSIVANLQVANAAKEGFKDEKTNVSYTFNCEQKAFVANDPGNDDDDEEDDDDDANLTGNLLTMKEWLENMPPEAKEVWNTAKQSHAKEKNQLIERLTANMVPAKRKGVIEKLKGKSIEDLRDLADMIPAAAPTGNTGKRGTAHVGYQPPHDDDTLADGELTDNELNDVLPIPKMTYEKVKN